MDLAFHLGFLGDHAHLEIVAFGVSGWWGVNIVRVGGGGGLNIMQLCIYTSILEM